MKRIAFLMGVAALGTGCGSDPSDTYSDIIEELNEAFARICECSEDVAVCTDFFTFDASIAEDPCVVDAFALDEDGSQETLDCTLELAEDFNDCVEDNLSCSDESSTNACLDQLESPETECPDLPADVEAALEACDVDVLDVDDD
ncbi:MAG: hypothetical protein AAFX94_23410 [Myxococcota bacterium]